MLYEVITRLDSVVADISKAIEKCIKYFKTLGFKNIGFIGGDIERKEMFINSMKSSHLEVYEKCVITSYSIHYTKLYDSRYNDEQKNLETTVKYLGELPPQSVVAILNNYPILKIVDTLRKEDELAQQNNRVSNSATWILFMEPKMAAEVQDMMIKKPTIKS